MSERTIGQQVTKDWTLGEIVATYPSAVEIMLGHGLHCVGCGASYYETLEQGTMGHGMEESELQKILGEINSKIQENKPIASGSDLIVTQNAIDKIREFQKKATNGNILRISVSPGGCSGFSYKMSFEQNVPENDRQLSIDGVKFSIDGENFEKLKGVSIDFIDSLHGSGFKISNPNAHKSCGCGQSFG